MDNPRFFNLYSTDMQEAVMFVTYPNVGGVVEKVGIRYISTREGETQKVINCMTYNTQEAMMLLGTARDVWYALATEGWKQP